MCIWKLHPKKKKILNVDLKFNNITDKITGGFFNTSNEITQKDEYTMKIRE